MNKEDKTSILRSIHKGVLSFSQTKAEKLLMSFEDEFINKFSQKESFKYLCLIKNVNNKYILELSYFKKGDWENETDEMKSFILEIIGNKLRISLVNKAYKEKLEKLPIQIVESKSEFNYHNHNKIDDKKQDFELGIGFKINIKNENSGALGAFLELKKDKHYYLLTNHHVIIKSYNQLNKKVYSNNKYVANTYWGLLNNEYDIALAKLTKEAIESLNLTNSNFGKITIPVIGENVYKFGPQGPSSGSLYSSKAIVKVKSKVYKNQILFEDLHLNSGESGTVVRIDDNGKTGVLGLHFAGDSNLDISNNLFNLFKNKIYSFTDDNRIQQPEINFKTFIN